LTMLWTMLRRVMPPEQDKVCEIAHIVRQ
jgi:hypothetical protein